MAIINLNNVSGIPANFLKELKKYDRVFKENMFMETIMEEDHILSLIKEIDDYCRDNSIVGFHYTRAIPKEIASAGLICRTGCEIRNVFLTNYVNIFTQQELETVKKNWGSHFDFQQQKSRDIRLFFNFTTTALNNFGAEPLLTNFGGSRYTCLSKS